MMRRVFFAGVLSASAVLAMMSGCTGGASSVKKVDVSGRLTLDGEPVEGVTVYFVGDGHTGTGVTGADGTYSLVTGATPGKNNVYFQPAMASEEMADEGIDDYQLQMMVEDGGALPEGVDTGPKLPEKYQNPEQPAVQFDVPEGGATDADFRLTS